MVVEALSCVIYYCGVFMTILDFVESAGGAYCFFFIVVSVVLGFMSAFFFGCRMLVHSWVVKVVLW